MKITNEEQDFNEEITLRQRALNPIYDLVIAVDGTSASGKGSISAWLAEKYQLSYLESGLIYRQIAAVAFANDIPISEGKQLIKIAEQQYWPIQKRPELYEEKVTSLASQIAVIPNLRAECNKMQRQFIASNKRVIIDGRDIATVIAPNAHLKIYVDAKLNIRARRRYQQYRNNGSNISYEQVYETMLERDRRDKNRDNSPLIKAEDAFYLETSNMDLDAVKQYITEIIDRT